MTNDETKNDIPQMNVGTDRPEDAKEERQATRHGEQIGEQQFPAETKRCFAICKLSC